MRRVCESRMLFTVLTAIACTAGARQALPDERPESAVARLRREGIRAMINGGPKKLSAAGFNMTLPWERPLSGAKKTSAPDSPTILSADDFAEEAVEKLRSWALRCKQNDIVMMYMMYVAAEPSVRILTGLEPEPDGHLLNYIGQGGRNALDPRVKKLWPAHQYRHVVDWDGQAARWAPCPLERRIWLGLIRPQLELVARVLQETGASGGAALELETYCFYSIYPGMASQKKTFCYCDHCFYGFVRSLETPGAVLPRRRFDWLTRRGLRARYETYLEDSMASIVREMMDDVRKIDADFLFGMYPYAPYWYYDALIRGSGTPKLPCLLFPSAEYYSGYTSEPRLTFFGDGSTADSMDHLRRRQLPALYAGGIWSFSDEALAMATDRLVRGADGYWVYTERWSTQNYESIWKRHAALARWTEDPRGALPSGDRSVDCMAAAREWVRETRPDGLRVSDTGIAALYDGEAPEVSLVAAGFESDEAVARGWQGRGELPPRDTSVWHSGRASLRFEPGVERSSPMSPYIDQKVPGAVKGQAYELSFRAKTAAGPESIRLWVGRADSGQWPGYMWYTNYMLPPGRDWTRLRTAVSYGGTPPLVLRFWCPPTEGKLWLDGVGLKPVQARTIDVPIRPPAGVAGWGAVDWTLFPRDARCRARVVDPESGHDLRISLYPGDSLAPLEVICGLKPLVLRLEIFPAPDEPIVLESVQVRFRSRSGG